MTSSLLSMTGFGRASAHLGSRAVRVEIRSLNHRGLDVKVRAYELRLAPEIESEIVRRVRDKLARGAVMVSVSEESVDGAGGDAARVRQAFGFLDGLRRELGLGAPVDLATVVAYLGTGRTGATDELPASTWPALGPAVAGALDGLVAMRATEGAALLADCQRRLANLRALVERMAELAAAVPARAGRRLEERLAALAPPAVTVDPARLAQEMAMLADRLDVNEELVRLRAHLDHLGQLLAGQASEPPGRRMDFLAQELGRELNTLGGKIQDAAISALVVDGKAELEKLREQAQNIE
jgi:uncharacterized protein (TIGR00255 family)